MVAKYRAGRVAVAPLRNRLLNGCARGALLTAATLGIVLAEDARAGNTIPNNANNCTLSPAGNPFTVNAGSSVTGLGAESAIYGGTGAQWTLTNNGTVTGGVATIELKTVSTLINNGTIGDNTVNLGVYLRSGGTLTNRGSILAGTVGVDSEGNTDLQNKAGAVISAFNTGVQLGGTSTVTNAGTISGKTSALGMESGTLINQSTGMILGGIDIFGQVTVTNAGFINDTMRITGVGTVANMGTLAGIAMDGLGTVTNTGTVPGGITLQQGGTILNQGTILIIAGYTAAAMVTNTRKRAPEILSSK